MTQSTALDADTCISHSGETVGTASGVLAEIASCQVEYTYLALLTGNKMYWENVRRILHLSW